jgi:hypothetical protein
MVTNALVTVARGGDLGDIVLSAGTSYLGAELGAQVSPVTGSISSTLIESGLDATVSNVVANSIGSGLVSGTIAEVRGGDFADGFTGGVVGSVVGAGVTELTSIVSNSIVSTATTALDSTGTTANADFVAGFDSGVTSINNGNVGDSFSITVDGFDNVVGRSATTGSNDFNLNNDSAGISSNIVSEVDVSDIGIDNTGVDTTFNRDTDTGVDTNLNSAGSNFVGDSGGLDSVADIIQNFDTDAGDTTLNTTLNATGDAGIDTGFDTTLNTVDDTAIETAGDIEGEATTGGLNTLNTELTSGSDIDTGDDVVGGLTAVTGDQDLDNAGIVGADDLGNDILVRSGNVLTDTGADTGGTDAVGALAQVQPSNTNLGVTSAADAATKGGLNQVSTTGAKTDPFVNIVKGAVTKAVTGAVKKGITSNINKALGIKTGRQPSVVRTAVKNVAPKVVNRVVPKAVNVSKLTPVTNANRTVPTKANVKTLTPISNISGVSTLVNRKG